MHSRINIEVDIFKRAGQGLAARDELLGMNNHK